jgi:dienelactone hydrolase
MKSIIKFLSVILWVTLSPAYGFSGPEFVDINSTARIKVYTAGTKPAGTVIIVHGSDGVNGIGYDKWIRLINTWGYNAVMIDVFTKRGYTAIPNQGHLIPFIERAQDISVATDYIVKQSWALPAVAVIGFSQGGGTVLTIAKYNKNENIKGVVGLYPSCYWEHPPTNPRLPTVLHIGLKDDWAQAKYCGNEFSDPNYEVYLHPNASHAFDIERGHRTVHGRWTLWYDPDADSIAQKTAKKLFDRVLTKNTQ